MDETRSQQKWQVFSRRIEPLKELPRFEKHHRIPKLITAAERQFLQELCDQEIEADLEQKFALFRHQLGLKRKQLESRAVEECQGSLTTPHFDYILEVDFLEEDPAKICWQRSLVLIRDLRILQHPVCQKIFDSESIQLQMQLDHSIDLERFVDFIEENPLELFIDYDREVTWCELGSRTSSGKMRISQNRLTVFHPHGSAGLEQIFGTWMFFQNQLQQVFPLIVGGNLGGDGIPQSTAGGGEKQERSAG